MSYARESLWVSRRGDEPTSLLRRRPSTCIAGWTDERVELLRRLWADGLSCSQIAAELGGVTRNAVIGKVHRLGLSGRAKSPASKPGRPRTRKSRTLVFYKNPESGVFGPAIEPEPMPEPEFVDSIIPVGQRRTIFELKEDTCRWPIGDPGEADFFYCGGACSCAPYCSHHSRVAYKPKESRRPYIPQRGRAA